MKWFDTLSGEEAQETIKSILNPAKEIGDLLFQLGSLNKERRLEMAKAIAEHLLIGA